VLMGTSEIVFQVSPAATSDTPLVIVEDKTRVAEAPSLATRDSRLNLSRQRLEMLCELTERLTRLRQKAELLEDVMTICFDTLRFERGLIAIRPRPGEPPEWPVIRNLRSDSSGQLTVSRTILERALNDGERTILNDAAAELVDPTVSMARHHIRSAMCVPISYEEEIIGVIYGDRVTSSTVYERQDVDFLAALARQLSVGLMNARLMQEHKLKVQLESELLLARRIQSNLFPKDLPDRDDLAVAALNDPGRHVSGDYYDVLPFEDGRVGLVVGDVTGKGAAAAILMAYLQAMVRLTLTADADLADVCRKWNRLLHANTDVSKFITLVAGIIDPKARRFDYVNAGHFPPYLLAEGQVVIDQRDRAFLPLGVEPQEPYEVLSCTLRGAVTALLIFTDGLPEAMNEAGEQFGLERVRAWLLEHGGKKPAELIAGLRGQIRRFVGRSPQSDDITLLAVRLA